MSPTTSSAGSSPPFPSANGDDSENLIRMTWQLCTPAGLLFGEHVNINVNVRLNQIVLLPSS
jgi:hypothetical protein